MAWKIEIAGVNKTTSIDQKSGVSINLGLNERITASFTCVHGYMPALRSEVLIYDTNGTTVIFGGIIYSRGTEGVGLLTFMKVECVDWSIYISWRSITNKFSGIYTLKSFLQWIVDNYLVDYGISLAVGQVTGPSADLTDYVLTAQPIDKMLRIVTEYTGGYTWSVTPTKVLQMALSTSAPAAPYTITDANSNVTEIDWSESSEEYATKVVLVCGGTGTNLVTQTWTITAAHLAAGYLETFAPSIPTGGVSVTVNGGSKSIGGAGSELIWDWVTHRVTAGTYAPSVGNVLALTYTAQYPAVYIANSGVVPPIEAVIEMSDVTTLEVATDRGVGLLARYYQTTKHFKIETVNPGFRPGQQLTINDSRRTTGSVIALIESVKINLISDGFWRYSIVAKTGIFQSSALDYFRSLSGTPAQSTFTVGINPGVASSIVSGFFLGGSRNQSIAPAAIYTPVVDFIYFVAKAAFTAIVRVDLWARSAAIGCTARLYNVTTSAVVGTSSTITSTTPTSTTFTAPILAGNTYRLELLNSTSGEGVYGIGTLEST